MPAYFLFDAIRNHNSELVRDSLNDNSIDPNVRDSNGDTLLMHAINYKCQDIIELLLQDKRTDFNLKNKDGKTALRMAVEKREINIVKLLLFDRPSSNKWNAVRDMIYNKVFFKSDRVSPTPQDYDVNTILIKIASEALDVIVHNIQVHSDTDIVSYDPYCFDDKLCILNMLIQYMKKNKYKFNNKCNFDVFEEVQGADEVSLISCLMPIYFASGTLAGDHVKESARHKCNNIFTRLRAYGYNEVADQIDKAIQELDKKTTSEEKKPATLVQPAIGEMPQSIQSEASSVAPLSQVQTRNNI